MPGGSFQSTLCILPHQQHCVKPLCRNSEGPMLGKASALVAETMQKHRWFLLFLLSNADSDLNTLNGSGFL